MKKVLDVIRKYAAEEGHIVYRTRLVTRFRYYDFKVSQNRISVHMNGSRKILYNINTMRDAINFCQMLTSLEHIAAIEQYTE